MNGSGVAGTQVIRRVAAVLRAVSAAMPSGLSTTSVAKVVGLSRPTVHRILSSLTADGFIDHDPDAARWYLGPELYLMGTIASERYDITSLARDSVRALAEATGESAFLSARRGNETVCLIREEGSFPIRSFVLYEGARFPLGVASAGLAILSFLPDDQVDSLIESRDLTERYGQDHAPAALRTRVLQTRASGYALNPGLIVEGSWGMGAAVFDADGRPAWALSITGVESRFTEPRQSELGRMLLAQAHRISKHVMAQDKSASG